MYNRVLLKLSGEALSNQDECFDVQTLNRVASEIQEIAKRGVGVAVVVGGGNFVRGRTLSKLNFDRVTSDYIGMLGTVMNAMALEATLNQIGTKAVAMSAIDAPCVLKHNPSYARQLLEEGKVVIFGGGTGRPFFSTDTTSALCASEIKADVILIAKNGVDGVYNADPNVDKTAKRYDVLTFDDILEMNLQVIDQTAATMCKDNNIEAFVFDMKAENSIVDAAFGKIAGTHITNGRK